MNGEAAALRNRDSFGRRGKRPTALQGLDCLRTQHPHAVADDR